MPAPTKVNTKEKKPTSSFNLWNKRERFKIMSNFTEDIYTQCVWRRKKKDEVWWMMTGCSTVEHLHTWKIDSTVLFNCYISKVEKAKYLYWLYHRANYQKPPQPPVECKDRLFPNCTNRVCWQSASLNMSYYLQLSFSPSGGKSCQPTWMATMIDCGLSQKGS